MEARIHTNLDIKLFNLQDPAKDNIGMPLLGPASSGPFGRQPAFAIGLSVSAIVRKCETAKEARALPAGSVVGDIYGGLTFTDEVAAIFESRSYGGWQEIEPAPGEHWTVITLNR